MRDLALVSYKMIRESKQPSPAKKGRRGCTFFISHLSIQNRNDKVA